MSSSAMMMAVWRKLFGFACVGLLFTGTSQALGQQPIITFSNETGSILLAKSASPATICVDEAEWPGVIRAARDLAFDFGRVTGTNGTVVTRGGTDADVSTCHIVVGTVGKSPLIDNLSQNKDIDVSEIEGKWEVFRTEVVQQAGNTNTSALVIAGSDKRGTIYGIYDISEQIGVSPWYFWADVAPHQHNQIYALAAKAKTQSSPSVKYRGIFINDEAPALSNYIANNFANLEYGRGYGHEFYATVFELLLRLRANYLWPAMWGNMFYYDDPKNGPLADEYGIVMGTSHTEPLACATKEWGNFGTGAWDWRKNRANIEPFLRKCAERAKDWETLYTIGMRGYDDTALSPNTEIELLEEIVSAQRAILDEVNDGKVVPQVWTLYEEVMDYYTQGMQVPDDIITIWADDNWGNIRRLPMTNETSRNGGSGVYYHFDLVGDPRSHKWQNNVQLERTLQQMVQAYDRGAQSLWVVNVGDLKPQETPINHFLDLAYDIDRWRSPNSTMDWLQNWAEREFGSDHAREAADLAHDHALLASRRVYEAMDQETYSIINYEEAETLMAYWRNTSERAGALHDSLPEAAKPAFFEMVAHPLMAGEAVYGIHLKAAYNALYAEQGRNSANQMAKEVLESLDKDNELTEEYSSLLGGKWNGMMDQTHLGYTYWQQPQRQFTPPLYYVHPKQTALFGPLGVAVEGSKARIPGDSRFNDLSSSTLSTPPIDPYGRKTYIDVFSTGAKTVQWNITAEPFVKLTQRQGELCPSCGENTDVRVYVSIDWDLLARTGLTKGVTQINITSSGGYGSGSAPPKIKVPFNNTKLPDDFNTGFVESDGHISIEAEHYTRLTDTDLGFGKEVYTFLPGYGRTLGAMTLANNTIDTLSPSSAPAIEYDFYKFTDPASTRNPVFNLTAILGTGLNTNPGRPLKFAAQVDDSPIKEVVYIGPAPPGRQKRPDGWKDAVFDAAWVNTTMWNDVVLKEGKHTLRVWLLEPGTVLTKLMLNFGGLRESYLGPPESFRVGH